MVQKILSFKESMEAWVEGVKEIVEPQIILMLAWGMGAAIKVRLYKVIIKVG